MPSPRTFLSQLLFFHHNGGVRPFHGSPSRFFGSRVKKKWPSKYKPVGASHLAVEFMDAHYPRLYGPKLWTQMRCALLSPQKYAMLFNSYQLDLDRCHAAALEAGAAEIMADMRTRLTRFQAGDFRRTTAEGEIFAYCLGFEGFGGREKGRNGLPFAKVNERASVSVSQ